MQGHFPEPEKDPVIQIASMVTVQGEDRPTVRNVMTLKGCAPIVGSEVMSFDDEISLLRVSSTFCYAFCKNAWTAEYALLPVMAHKRLFTVWELDGSLSLHFILPQCQASPKNPVF